MVEKAQLGLLPSDIGTPKRRRKGAPKSRAGCVTCKIRRVKCDETRPSCNKCTSTGRVCDFVQTQDENFGNSKQPSVSTKITKPIKRMLDPQGQQRLLPRPNRGLASPFSAHEISGLEYFRLICTQSFLIHDDNPLWNKTILQVARTESSIRNAVIAVSILLRHQNTNDRACNPGAKDASNSHFLDAIQLLNNRLDNSSFSWELALIGSLLFTSFEVLRGNVQASSKHFQAGHAMVANFESKSPNPSTFKEIRTAFSRLDTQATTFALFYTSKSSAIPVIPATFETLANAREILEMIIVYIDRLFKPKRGRHRTLPYTSIRKTLSNQLSEVELFLQKWLSSLKISRSLLETEDNALEILRVQHLALVIQVSTLFYRDELAYDAFLEKFKEIIQRSELIIKFAMGNHRGFQFSFDLGIIPSLFFTACKCRDPVWRRKAIFLLKRSGIEGPWDGGAMAAAASWVMEYEESLRSPKDDDRFVPESRRLREIGFALDRDSKKVMLVSITNADSGNPHHVRVVVSWRENTSVVIDHPDGNPNIKTDEESFESWVARWRGLLKLPQEQTV